jgi:hypothetical protein
MTGEDLCCMGIVSIVAIIGMVLRLKFDMRFGRGGARFQSEPGQNPKLPEIGLEE